MTDAGKTALTAEMGEMTTNGGDPINFSMTTDANGVTTISGVDGDGNPVLDITMTPTMDPATGDVTVTTDVNQYQPLDDNNGTGENTGLITNIDDVISVELPFEIDDTDGDTSDVTVHVNFKDGEDPSFGADTGASITENDGTQTANGSIEFDQGSDHVDQIVFDTDQAGLDGITSNGEATTYSVDGNDLTLVDTDGNTVLSVTIDAQGNYVVTQEQPIDQNDGDITDIALNVHGTDDDGDTANGTINIHITDGDNAADVTDTVTVDEGDVQNPAEGNEYPVHGSSSVTIESPSDNLDPSTLRMTDAGKTALTAEMGEMTTNGGDPINFSMTTDANGVTTISGVDGAGNPVLDITMTPTMDPATGDVTVTTDVNQYQPLDDNNGTGENTGLITNIDDVISVELPFEIDDTDGDTSDVTVHVNFKDGEDPSFGMDTGASITENDGTQTANGSIEFDQGSDHVDQIVFDTDQAGLDGITSNGEATTYSVDGNDLTLVDTDGNTVLSVTIDAQGNYVVTQEQPIDQNDGDITDIALNVHGTDDDGDTANGTINIHITDGDNAADVTDTVTVDEGDVQNPAEGNEYPVHGSSSVTIESPSDNLDPSTLRMTDAGKTALTAEMGEMTTNGGDPINFSMTTDANGVTTISGVDGDGNPVLDITMTPTFDPATGNVTVDTVVNQYQPLDDNNGTGENTGLITNIDDVISVELPFEIDDTDGDTSDVTVHVNFKDGEDPSFGADTGASITENDGTQTANGSIEFDQGSDHVDQIVFDTDQAGLDGITSNGEATTYSVDGNDLTLVDTDGNTVLSVTIDAQGNYVVTQEQPIDQNDGDITDIALNVHGTDDDGDTANGTINIHITDGDNAADVTDTVTVDEGDVQNPAEGNEYPVHGSSSVTIESPSDNLDPSTLRMTDAGKTALTAEMGEMTTNGGDPINFSMTTDANGVTTISGVDGDGNPVLDITMTPTMDPATGDVTVTTDVNQYQPLDDNNGTGENTGLITNIDDVISVELPFEIDDTDGDTSDVTVHVNFKDGEDPSFGADTGASITENDGTQTANGSIEFDQGSDHVDQIVFDTDQAGLDGITSNGEATTYSVDGNDLTLVDTDGNTVLSVTIDAQGNYVVTQEQPIDQNDGDITDIALNVHGTDDDGDTANGTINIHITDGDNAADVTDTVTVDEGDVQNPAEGNEYPVHGSSSVTIESPSDNLDPSTLRMTDAGKTALTAEMGEMTTNGGDPINFSMTTDANGVTTISGVDGDGNPVLDITMTPTMDPATGDVTVTTDVNQYQPLDDNNGTGENTGLITNIDDVISVELPFEIDDTDGDTSDVTVHVNFKDGEDPSFGADTGASITENDGTQTANGSIEFDQGSDHVDAIVFDADQPGLAGITSNGEATHIDTDALATDPSTLVLADPDGNPVLSVTIDAQGNYVVTQEQPIDQNDGDTTDIAINVHGTDDDGDTANGTINIHITDGDNAADASDTINVDEGDVQNADGESTYPVHGSSSVTIESPSDNLDPSTLRMTDAGKTALTAEMGEMTTNGGDPINFSMTTDANGVTTISGVDGDGNPVLDITMTPTMDPATGDVTVTTDVNQYQPLDDNNGTGENTGLITNIDDVISVELPFEIDDTDGDTSDVTVHVNFKDGEDPSFGVDTGASITENDGTQTANGSIEFDQGSDHVDQIVFDTEQAGLDGITSNGEATTYSVDGNDLTLVDTDGNTVLSVTIDAQGNYVVTQEQPIDQNDGDITDIALNVHGTDDDGDTANGTINIHITDGDNAADVTDTVTVDEGDVQNPAEGNEYPVHGSSSVTIESPSDNLDPSTLRMTDAGKTALTAEMGEMTTNGGDPINFSMTTDANGVTTISGVDGAGNPVLDITMTPTFDPATGNVTVDTVVNQYQPLDDNNGTGENTGLITNIDDVISVELPFEIDDTDGDTSDVTVHVNFKDGEDPSFGADTGASITENDGTQTANGSIEFDQGSDHVDQIVFDTEQAGLDGITSNGEATTYSVDGNDLTLVDTDGNTVLSVTIDAQGNYVVTQEQPIDQNDGDITDIALNVHGTDDDGDTANGTINIHITDGDNAADVTDTINVDEGDVQNADGESTYPVHGSSSVTIESPSDNLDPSTLRMTDAGKTALTAEMGEMTTNGGDPINFSMTTDANGVTTISGVDGDGNPVLDITMTPTMDPATGDVTVTTDVNQYQPLDDNNGTGENTGLITNIDDVISVELPFEIDDTDGDTSDVTVHVNFKDGEDPTFTGTTDIDITETDNKDGPTVTTGDIDLDKGSDEIKEIGFDPDQSDSGLGDITVNGGQPTEYTVDGDTISVTDMDGNDVLSITLNTDGTYTFIQSEPIDQDKGDVNLDLNVYAIDDDGDKANGDINIVIHDSDSNDTSDTVVITEGDLENGDNYPVSGSSSVVVDSSSDDLDPSTLAVDPAALDDLMGDLDQLTSDGQALVFTMTINADGSVDISGGFPGSGDSLLDINMQPVLDADGNVTLTTTVTQNGPLDHIDFSSDYITANGDQISIDVPMVIDDTDGTETKIDITVNIEDGQDPSFGVDTGASITENDGTQTANGSIEFDQGSDHVDQIVFDTDQAGLDGITSNGEATTYSVDGNDLTLVDTDGNTVLSVTIDAQGNYVVTQEQPIDQNDGDITDIALNVHGTDDDGDTANGTINIHITDGDNAADVTDTVTVDEGDVQNPAEGNEYPVHGSSSVTIESPSDNLDPSTLRMTNAGKTALTAEMGEMTTNGGDPINFSMTTDANGVTTISGVDGDGNPVLDITMTPTFDPATGNVTVDTVVNQYQPLDDNNGTGENTGLITNIDDVISVELPFEIDDTDGDTSDVTVHVNFKDGEDPSFGADTGASITENDGTQTANGSIEFDQGSDHVDQIVFDTDQAGLDGITSNGEATTYSVDGNDLTLVDTDGNTVLSVTIDAQGNYVVTQEQPIDQNDGDITDIALNVHGTDDDGDTANGTINIHITDGDNAADVTDTVTVDEGDVQNPAEGNEYPVHGSSSVTIESPSDNLDPSTLRMTDAGKTALTAEMGEMTTNGGDPINFSMTTDANGVTTISGVDGDGNPVLDITMTPTFDPATGNVTVDTVVNQYQPLDDNNGTGENTGLITNIDDVISVELPFEIDDTDGDTSDVTVHVNFKDGEDPTFTGTTDIDITETDNKDGPTVTTGDIELDKGSDEIKEIGFDPDQSDSGLGDITVNGGQPTEYTVDGDTISVTDMDGNDVLSITLNTDGTYTFTQSEPIDQDKGDVNLDLNVYAIDDDGDKANGDINIVIHDSDSNDTSDTVVITEGDLENGDNYPVSGSSSVVVDSSSDDLDPSTLAVDPAALDDLMGDLDQLTSDGQALVFTMTINADGSVDISGGFPGSGDSILDINMQPVLDADGNVTLTTTVTQNGPLDHIDFSSDYITANGDQISIDVPMVIDDTDGTETKIDITVNIEDGQDPSFGDDSGVDLSDDGKIFGVDFGSGKIDVDTGSDEVKDVRFGQDQSQLDDVTSNGQPTTVNVSEDGTWLSITNDVTGLPVMILTIDDNGQYNVVQTQPIDQDNSELSNLDFNVEVEDADGDIGKGTITVRDTDGGNATGGGEIDIHTTEGDLTPDGGSDNSNGDGYPVHGEGSPVVLEPGVDDFDPSTVQIDPNSLDDLITELDAEITTAGGEAVTFSFNPETGVLQGVDSNNDPVLDISLNAVPTDDGGVSITVSMDQFQPIDHSGVDDSGMVQYDENSDTITIDFPIQIQDTDGDFLDNPIDFHASITDGDDPFIISADSITVDESATADGSHTDVTPDDGLDPTSSTTGQITVDSGSDGVTHFAIDVNAFNNQNTITSGGDNVTLVDNGDGTFSGVTDNGGDEVFNISFSEDGTYTFTVDGAIDDPLNDATGGTSVSIDIPIYGIDDDGDKSNTINANVTINDDVPVAQDVTKTVTEGDQLTDMGNIIASQGNDGASVTGIVVDGEVVALDTLPTVEGQDGNTYYQYDVSSDDASNQDLGQLYISADGEVYFKANPELVHSGQDLSDKITFVITDGDGDTDTSDVTINVKDDGITINTNDTNDSSGQEQDGNHTTDPNDNVDPNHNVDGIPVNMSIDVGDIDEHESLTQVTITPEGEAHGVFEYNGDPIPINADGSVTIPGDAFTLVDNGDGTATYEMSGITFVPDDDFSTNNVDLQFDVNAIVNDDAGTHSSDATFSITVDGIADTPTWNEDTGTYIVANEDDDSIHVPVEFDSNDSDGSESLMYHVRIEPDENGDTHGTIVDGIPGIEGPDENGYYDIPADSIDQLAIKPDANYSGDIKLDIYATSTESGNVVDGKGTADSDHQEIVINVDPVADDMTIHADANIKDNEDTAIHLADVITANPSADTDGSETYFVQLSGLPDGAVVMVNGEPVSPDENGVYNINVDDLDNADLIPPPQSNVDFTFSYNGLVVDTATGTDADGNPISGDDTKVINGGDINVDMHGEADDPVVVLPDDSAWDVSDPIDGRTAITTTIGEDGTATIDFSFSSGEYDPNNPDGGVDPDSDTSETLTFGVGDIPDGVTFSDADGNPLHPVLVSANPDIYQLDVDDLKGLQIHLPENSSEDITIPVRIVMTENDGDSTSIDYDIVVKVNPEVDGVGTNDDGSLKDYDTATSTGYEDNLVKLNWDPTSQLVDDSEKVTGLTINGFPPGYSIVIDGEEIQPDVNGSITLTSDQLAEAMIDTDGNGDGIYLKMPEDSDVDIHLTTDVTISDQEADDPNAATNVIHGDIDVDVDSVVEGDGHLEVDDSDGNAITDQDGDGKADIYEDSDTSNEIHLTTNELNGGSDSINWINDDGSSTEDVTKVIIKFNGVDVDANGNSIVYDDNGKAYDVSDFYIPGATNNGDGSFTITQDSIDDIVIKAPPGFDGSIDITISAEVVDHGDNNEGDTSKIVTEDSDITLHFNGIDDGGGDSDKAADIVITDATGSGVEDGTVNLGDLISGNVVINTSDNDGDGKGDQTNDTFSIAIDADDLPDGAVINGMTYNESTGQYVFSVTPDADGNVDLSGITMDLPPDYAGKIDFPIVITETDNDSGDTNSGTMNIDIDVTPVADDPVITIDGTGDEDSIITLDLNAAFGDQNNDGPDNGGQESFGDFTLTVDPDQGQFVDANGNPIGNEDGSITISDIDQPIYFKPADDFSGKVDVNIKTDVTDDASTGSDTKQIDTDVSFDVIAVNDGVDVDGTDNIHGDEDGNIPLDSITGDLIDTDGSEHIVSISISDLPPGFTVEGGANLSDGVWTLTNVQTNEDGSFELSGYSINPPDDFSGDVTITLKVFTQEDSLDEPAENDIPITFHVDPHADAVNTNVVTEASGEENGDIVLHFNAHDVDDAATGGSDSNVNEDAPEQVQITISNVPEGATFAFPEGESGSITTNPDGSVTIISDTSDLDSIIFNPGDANSDNWDGQLNYVIQGNDNGVTDGPTTNGTINVDVTPENDAAEISAPDSVDADNADGVTTITGIQISDIDADEGKGDFTVELKAENGTLSLPEGTDTSGINITVEDDGTYKVTGSLDDINAVLAGGVNYTPNDGFSGDDKIDIKTTDNGDADGNNQLVTNGTIDINDVVAPDVFESQQSAPAAPASIPQAASLGADLRNVLNSSQQVSAANASTIMPLAALLLTAAVAAQDGETLTLGHMQGAQVVDADNQPLGSVQADGSVELTADQVAIAYVQHLESGTTPSFSVTTKDADNRVVSEHKVEAGFTTSGSTAGENVVHHAADHVNHADAANNVADEHAQLAAVGEALHAAEGHDAAALLAANPDVAETLHEQATDGVHALTDDLHAIVDQATALDNNSMSTDAEQHLQPGMEHDNTLSTLTDDAHTNPDLAPAFDEHSSDNTLDAQADNDQHDIFATDSDDDSHSADTMLPEGLFDIHDIASDIGEHHALADLASDGGLFGEENEDGLLGESHDGGLFNDSSDGGLFGESTEGGLFSDAADHGLYGDIAASGDGDAHDGVMSNEHANLDMSDLFNQDGSESHDDMDKLLGDAAPSEASDIGKATEASSDDLASTQHLDHANVSGFDLDVSGVEDTSSAGHIINDLFNSSNFNPDS